VTISELGSLGEFIGSIAVLVTLVYLAIQVRLARAQSAAIEIKDRGHDKPILHVYMTQHEATRAVRGRSRMGPPF
jgi:hypothetical protein